MAGALYYSVNFGDSQAATTTDKPVNMNDFVHVRVKSGFVYYKTLFKVSHSVATVVRKYNCTYIRSYFGTYTSSLYS